MSSPADGGSGLPQLVATDPPLVLPCVDLCRRTAAHRRREANLVFVRQPPPDVNLASRHLSETGMAAGAEKA